MLFKMCLLVSIRCNAVKSRPLSMNFCPRVKSNTDRAKRAVNFCPRATFFYEVIASVYTCVYIRIRCIKTGWF